MLSPESTNITSVLKYLNEFKIFDRLENKVLLPSFDSLPAILFHPGIRILILIYFRPVSVTGSYNVNRTLLGGTLKSSNVNSG